MTVSNIVEQALGRHYSRASISRREAAHFQRAMMMALDQAAPAMKDAEIEAEIEDFLEGFNQPTYRGKRINGVRVPVWSSRRGMSSL